MSSNQTKQSKAQAGSAPKFRDKVQGKIEEIKGKVEASSGDRHGDLIEEFEGVGKQLAGKLRQDISNDTAALIAARERESAKAVLEGQKHRIKGAVAEASGKAQAQFGRVMKKPEQEAKGEVKELAGHIEKVAGHIHEDVAKDALHRAVHADSEYMKPK